MYMITLIIKKVNLVMHLYIRYTSTSNQSQNSVHCALKTVDTVAQTALMGAIMGAIMQYDSDVRYD